jgi:hypothetical protein
MTKQRSKRIFGMTMVQFFILLCLGFSILGAGAWMAAKPPTPTATPIPYEAHVPENWRQHTTENIEIWLPENFSRVDNQEAFSREFTEIYEKIGLGEFIKQRQKNLPVYELLLRYNPATANQYIPTVFIKQFDRSGLSLPQFVDKAISVLGVNYSLVERKPFDFLGTQGERVIVQANYNNVYLNFVYYLALDGDTIWEIGADAHMDDFYNLLPVYDDIARSFRPLKQP